MSSIKPINNNLEHQLINLKNNDKLIDSEKNHPKYKNASYHGSIIRLGRIADIIFALAMAQCFFAVDFPAKFDHPTNSEAIQFLLTQIKPLISYGLAFIIVGFYWLDNINQFKHYQRTDTIHSSLYLLYLMMMFLIPYADTLVVYFPESAMVKICFSINTALIGFLSCLNWTYATYKNKLVAYDLDKKTIIATRWKIAIEPVFSLLTILVAIINQSWWEYVWFLLPIPYLWNERIFGKS
ncbi:TMEM175 family protein [Crocosphaera chwakensis]|uniref:DUF1211 domain-containing protein n=1 Tax=Crocosphaera chwakensis CCY0110 TaxID=391612 RepID=A3ILP3_9CHRO|nr:TMEM175 family protein [Crocosphaera chwakensis]EAZ92694.1 hypothetical protein CY0110_24046 [Crocosphaera chwakensis CCY0110]